MFPLTLVTQLAATFLRACKSYSFEGGNVFKKHCVHVDVVNALDFVGVCGCDHARSGYVFSASVVAVCLLPAHIMSF